MDEKFISEDQASLIGVESSYQLWNIPAHEAGHRECDAFLLLVFKSNEDASKHLGKKNGIKQLRKSWELAIAGVSDPDLALGDFGINVFGERDKLPIGVLNRIAKMSANYFVMRPRGIVPHVMNASAVTWMETEVPFRNRPKKSEQRLDHFAIYFCNDEVGRYHVNNMSWHNARISLLRDGIITGNPMSESEAEKLAMLYDIEPISVHDDLPENIVRAPKRKAGTAPTHHRTIERYYNLIDALGIDVTKCAPLPPLNADANKIVKVLSDKYQELKKSGLLPPTDAQIRWAHKLSVENHTPLPEEASRKSLSIWIDEQSKIRIDRIKADLAKHTTKNNVADFIKE